MGAVDYTNAWCASYVFTVSRGAQKKRSTHEDGRIAYMLCSSTYMHQACTCSFGAEVIQKCSAVVRGAGGMLACHEYKCR
jgi:hypothetical protein